MSESPFGIDHGYESIEKNKLAGLLKPYKGGVPKAGNGSGLKDRLDAKKPKNLVKPYKGFKPGK